MHRFEEKRSVRIRGLGIAAALIVAAGAAGSSCVLDTKTNFCAEFGLTCREGQECAANQPVCIDIGGCGNGVIDVGEVCDDGNILDGETDADGVFVPDPCNRDCTSNQQCGNAVKDAGEECDDGVRNGDADGTCDSECRLVSRVCGNGMVEPAVGEQCDEGATDSPICNSSMAGEAARCKFPRCGDSYTNLAATEECDSGGQDTAMCIGRQCKFSVCGDNYINIAAGETCEVGSPGNDSDTCNGVGAGLVRCRKPACGDGYINAMFEPPNSDEVEVCDNFGGVDTATCNGNNVGNNGPGSCQISECGDRYPNAMDGEQCDGGTSDTADCIGTDAAPPALHCKSSQCGDGYINTAAQETCDVLGGTNTAACNGKNAGNVSCRASVCGDRYINTAAGESCDSGMANTATCNGGGSSIPQEVRCKDAVCGDKYVNTVAGEQCDPSTTGADTSFCNGKSAGAVSCKSSVCGDGYRNSVAGEDCDLGNADSPTCNGSGAGDKSCKSAMCGDGHVNAAANEQCEKNSDCASPMQCMGCRCM